MYNAMFLLLFASPTIAATGGQPCSGPPPVRICKMGYCPPPPPCTVTVAQTQARVVGKGVRK